MTLVGAGTGARCQLVGTSTTIPRTGSPAPTLFGRKSRRPAGRVSPRRNAPLKGAHVGQTGPGEAAPGCRLMRRGALTRAVSGATELGRLSRGPPSRWPEAARPHPCLRPGHQGTVLRVQALRPEDGTSLGFRSQLLCCVCGKNTEHGPAPQQLSLNPPRSARVV